MSYTYPIRFQPRLAPAPPRPPPAYVPRVTFLDLPAELRVEIYKLALENITVHVVPIHCDEQRRQPLALTRTSRQIRQEVIPLMHALCPIRCSITDFNFDSLLGWLQRIAPAQQANLCKNEGLTINFSTSSGLPRIESLRKWLHIRADPHRSQPNWRYSGSRPADKICKDLSRKCKRMRDRGRQQEFALILASLDVPTDSGPGRPRARDQ